MNIELQLQKVLAECEILRKENEDLKRLIKQQSSSNLLDEKVVDSNNVITNQSNQLDKIQLLNSLFKGRTDVFAKRWESKNGSRTSVKKRRLNVVNVNFGN